MFQVETMSGAITSWYTRCSADDATRCTLCVRPMNPPRLIGTLSISSLLCSFIYINAFKNRILKFAITNLREQAYRGNRKYKPTSQFHNYEFHNYEIHNAHRRSFY